MHGVLLTLAYDGTAYAGWQRQPGQSTVQGALELALRDLLGEDIPTRGASRTDSGVHARHQWVAFDTEKEIAPMGWVCALNTRLPDDIRVVDARPCAPESNPRFGCDKKHYRYLLRAARVQEPLLRHRVWHLRPALFAAHVRTQPPIEWLDIPAMEKAARHLLGTHDFKAFRAASDEREYTIRTIERLDLTRGLLNDPLIVAIDVVGDGFMKNMVRILAGTLVEVGRGRCDPDEMPNLLSESASRPMAGQTAPAHGLCLEHIWPK